MSGGNNNPPIYNEAGEVAVRYYQPTDKMVQLSNGHRYAFRVRRVSIAWIKPEDLQEVLRIPYGCCGQKMQGAFFLPNQLSVDMWLGVNKDGR